MENELSKRLFDFAVRVINLLKTLPDSPEVKIIRYQLIKSSSSSGANYEEAQAGLSRPDFANKVRIALREMRESNYWLRIIDFTVTLNAKQQKEVKSLISESKELLLILASILNKTR